MKNYSYNPNQYANFGDCLIGKIFLKKYLLVQKLGEGSFGSIYMGIYKQQRYALKFEKKKLDNGFLETESFLLNYLKGPGIPYVKSFGSCNEYNILVMELLGKSLEDLLMSSPEKRFSIRTVCNIGIQMITVVSYIHNKHIIHRDIKPDNFVTGISEKMNEIYLIDFGLSKKYRSTTTLAHYPMKNMKKLTGTARYASINALKGFEQSRRDDLESISYLLVYLLNGKLPWQGILKNKDNRYQKIIEKKESITPIELCKGFPKEFADFTEYTKGLEYEQNPNYEYLKRLLLDVLKHLDYEYDLYCDWFHFHIQNNSTLPIINEDPNQISNDLDINNDNSEYNIGNAAKQIKVEKAVMNQFNNIVIINTTSDNNCSGQFNGNVGHTSNGLHITGPIRLVKTNQALDISLDNQLRSENKVDQSQDINQHEDKMPEDNANLNSSVPLYHKHLNAKPMQCSMCCLIF